MPVTTLWSIFWILVWWEVLRLYYWYLTFKHTTGLLRGIKDCRKNEKGRRWEKMNYGNGILFQILFNLFQSASKHFRSDKKLLEYLYWDINIQINFTRFTTKSCNNHYTNTNARNTISRAKKHYCSSRPQSYVLVLFFSSEPNFNIVRKTHWQKNGNLKCRLPVTICIPNLKKFVYKNAREKNTEIQSATKILILRGYRNFVYQGQIGFFLLCLTDFR